MSTFINNIKNHKKLAVICAAVLVAAVAVTVLAFVLANREEKGSRELYFEGTDYPVYVTKANQKMKFELDGSKSANLAWTYAAEPGKVAHLSKENSEKKGKLTLSLKALETGYATAVFRRSSEIAGIPYDAVTIYADYYVSENEKGEKSMTLTDMRQVTATVGALDTQYPYLADGSRILLPNGGDWQMTAEIPEGLPEDLFVCYQNFDENGHMCIEVVQKELTLQSEIPDEYRNLSLAELIEKLSEEPNQNEQNSSQSSAQSEVSGEEAEILLSSVYDTVFVLKSESLGIEQRLQFKLNGNQKWVLCAAEVTG
ncbi:MAG: hypothetical protein IKI58_01760 [Oscillospiraceae bacterium]|nr:hypothetical protein [Oscillospiraceae bacterium]